MRYSGLLSLLAVLGLPGCCLAHTAPPVYDPVVLASGVLVQDIVVPETEGPGAGFGDRIELHYELSLEDGTRVDSSWERGLPVELTLGDGQLPRGVEEGVVGMRRFGRRALTVPPAMGYGTAGRGSSIPPDAVLVFLLELMGLEVAEER